MNTTEHTAKCLRCGRTLRAASSVAAGYGRGCRARIRAAAITRAVRHYTAEQVTKALELIADRGMVPTRREGIYQSVSSKGDATYLTAATGQCNCPAGLRGRQCYHGAAAQVMTAKAA